MMHDLTLLFYGIAIGHVNACILMLFDNARDKRRRPRA